MRKRERIDSDRIPAREQCPVMHGVIWMRFRTVRISCKQAIHDIEDHFVLDHADRCRYRRCRRRRACRLGEAAPVVDVRQGDIIETTSEPFEPLSLITGTLIIFVTWLLTMREK